MTMKELVKILSTDWEGLEIVGNYRVDFIL